MSQLIDNLNTIESIKTDIKAAIENKGVDMTGVSFPGYASKIGEISGGGTVGWDQKSFTEGTIEIINLDNSASFVVSSAFDGNKTIQTVNLPYATIVRNYAFRSCTSLTQVNLPMCSYISGGAFQNCISLTQISLPMCSYIGNNAFNFCKSLSQVSIPMCSYIGNNAFSQCFVLAQVNLPMCSYIGSSAFRNCISLSIITIGYSSVCRLNASSTFYNTPIASGTGSIYVPTSLVDSYKSAKNWSYFSTQIFPIE